MTPKQQELYNKTMKRLGRMGAKGPTKQIVALAEEIERYRTKILRLEEELKRRELPNGQQPQEEAKTNPPNCGSSVQTPTRTPETWHTRIMQKPAKKPEKTTAEVVEMLERHIELMKTAAERLAPGAPLSVVARPEVEALACIKRLQAQVQFVARKPKRTTCKECKKYHTTDCALWYGTVNDKQYFREHGGDFSCSWAERKGDGT